MTRGTHFRLARTAAIGLALAASTLASAATGAGAQEIAGVVLDQVGAEPLAGALVSLIDDDGVTHATATTGPDGRFRLAAPRPGAWTVAVTLIGFHPIVADPVPLADRSVLEVEITLSAAAVPLEPLVITGRRAAPASAHRAFYDRMETGRRTGLGHFISRDEVERAGSYRATDLVRRVGGVRVEPGRGGRGAVVRMTGGCIPAIFIDGAQINRLDRRESLDHYLSTMDIEGIEVYRGPAHRVEHYHDPGGCGMILAWTRRGDHDGDTPATPWRTRLLIIAAIAAVFLLFN